MSRRRTITATVTRGLMSPVFPVLILLVFTLIATTLRTGISSGEEAQIRQNLAAEASDLAANMEQDFLNHVTALKRMALRRSAQPDMPPALWRIDARRYLEDFQTFQAIEWIDSDFIIRWIEPIDGNEKVQGFNVAFSPQRRRRLEEAAASGQADISGVIELQQGGTGVVVYAPVGSGAGNRGFIAGVFRMERLITTLLTARIREQFDISILEDGEPVFSLAAGNPTQSGYSHRVALDLPAIDWTLSVTASQRWVQASHSNWPAITFLSTVILGLVTALTTLLAQLFLRRNQALLQTRQELDDEIGQRQAIQQDLARLESTNTLTGLANRRFFMEDVAHTLAQADRKLQQVALVMIDLDRFQMLNDSLGHQFGDELLIRVAERLNTLSDERVLVAYSGGDEFMVCQQHVADIDDVIHLLGQLKQCFSRPFQVQGDAHGITATMGVAVYPQSGLDADILLRNADIALYRAKERGRNTYQFYTEGMQEREVRRLELEKDLSDALACDQFVLYYQPQLDLVTLQSTSVEALIRWQHPQRGLVSPAEFIPLAEESGRIAEIGRWVLRAACRQLAAWRNGPLQHLRIAINLSGQELAQDDLVDYIRDTLAEFRLRPCQLEVELTEEIFIDNIERNLKQLQRLSALGVQLAIDDFGVGYSSLAYLRDFPVDLLKIDRSFITDVTERHDDAVITRAVINLAHNLGIRVVAEGVETESQLQFLKTHRCDLAQGFLISRPVPAEKLGEAMSPGMVPKTSAPPV